MEVSHRRTSFNRSIRELNNKNNLASLRLRKELESYDREKRFLIDHIEKDRVDTFGFLQQLQVCETNLVPAYKQLLEGIVTKPCLSRRRIRKSHTAPSLKGNSQDITSTDQEPCQVTKKLVPKFTRTQMKLLQSRQPVVSNKDRVEQFLKKLRHQRNAQREEEQEDGESEQAYTRQLSRLLSMAYEETRLPGNRWAKPRSSGFYSIDRLGSIASRNRPSETFDGQCVSQTIPELAPIHTKDFRISVSTPDDDPFAVSTTRPVRKPIACRLKTFYDKLEAMKKKQDSRLAGFPVWEKRRRWILLTQGVGAALAESESESEDDGV